MSIFTILNFKEQKPKITKQSNNGSEKLNFHLASSDYDYNRVWYEKSRNISSRKMYIPERKWLLLRHFSVKNTTLCFGVWVKYHWTLLNKNYEKKSFLEILMGCIYE